MKTCFGCKAKGFKNKCEFGHGQAKRRVGHGDQSRLTLTPTEPCPRPTNETQYQAARFNHSGASVRILGELYGSGVKA